MPTDKEILSYKIIRQPYRITMAKWDFTVIQKRILTKIISMLQREIYLVSKGLSFNQLELFSSTDDSIKLQFPLTDIVKGTNNYGNVKKALMDLRSIDVQIVLPETKSRKNKMPEEEVILTGLIERAILTKYSRTVTVVIHKVTAQELIKVSNGLTQFAEEVMYSTNNIYSQKLYEMISHWKDQDVFSITPNDFRIKFSLIDKYPQIKDLIKRVIRPAETELKNIADVYFIFNTTVQHRKIIRFNFVIKHRKALVEYASKLDKLRNDNIYLLKTHFGFNTDHIAIINDILLRNDVLSDLRQRIIELYDFICEAGKSPQTAIKNVPQYVIKSLKNDFSP
ncbi:replication initiation protein [Mucilaginibacter lappiensis]|uniref:replication initiation protein n=1 Tax=Mucilaginibacter lappiensis TaxID=354630 RepID=UPI003D1B9285